MARPKKEKLKEVLKEEEHVSASTATLSIEIEMYNGKKIINKGEVEINGIKHKTITTEEGSTYTI